MLEIMHEGTRLLYIGRQPRKFKPPCRSTRTSMTNRRKLVSTGSPANVERCTSVRRVGSCPSHSKNTSPTDAGATMTNQQSSSIHTARTTPSTGKQLNSSFPSTDGFRDASEKPLKSTSMTLSPRHWLPHQQHLGLHLFTLRYCN